MVKIQYNDVEINVPESWDEIILGDFEVFYKAAPSSHRERVAQVCKLCKLDPDLVLNWPAEVFTEVLRITGFIFEDNTAAPCSFVELDGVKYHVAIEDELTLGAYIDADEVQRGGVAILSNVLAIVCRPAGEEYNHRLNEERAAMFAAVPVSKVLGVLAFFLHFKQIFAKHTAALSSLEQVADLLPPNIKTLRRLTGGIKLLRIWPTIRYLLLIVSLRSQLQKYLRFYNTRAIKVSRKRHKKN